MTDVAPEAPTYTPPPDQDALNRIIEGRLAQERKKYADYDDVKAKASKFDEVDAASKSEMQKLQDAIAERDQKLADLPRELRKQIITFASLASAEGFIDPEDALAGIDVDLSDKDAVKTALQELAERKPHLVRKPEKSKLTTRPKQIKGEEVSGDEPGAGLAGKERAAAALRQFKNT